MILTAYYTGLREGELLSLRWEWIDLKDGVIYLPSTKTTLSGAGVGVELSINNSVDYSGGIQLGRVGGIWERRHRIIRLPGHQTEAWLLPEVNKTV